MNLKSEDVKRANSITLLKKLYALKSATMLELVEATNLSQSSVRSILKDLENKNILLLQTIDKSTDGRCAGRYTFNKNYFNILQVFVDEGEVEIRLSDIFKHNIYRENIKCDLDEKLEKHIIAITKKHSVNCISIGSSGVVKDDCFLTDQGDYMTKHEIAVNLKKY